MGGVHGEEGYREGGGVREILMRRKTMMIQRTIPPMIPEPYDAK